MKCGLNLTIKFGERIGAAAFFGLLKFKCAYGSEKFIFAVC